jgi:hypothetical protein
LELIKGYFGVGNLLKKDNYIEYLVNSVKDLEVIINHFDKFPLVTKKKADYILFKQAFDSSPAGPSPAYLQGRAEEELKVKTI